MKILNNFSLLNYYLKNFSNSNRAWLLFFKELTIKPEQSIATLEKWEKKSKIQFSSERYTEILQLSFMKNWHHLSEYLLEHKNFTYPFIKIPEIKTFSKIHFLDGFMSNHLIQEDHAAWLGLIACHHPYHLLQLEKNYDLEQYSYIAKKFFFHKSFKEIYSNKKRRELIISRCHTNAIKMLDSIFLEMDLDSSFKSTKPTKTIKI